MSQIDEMRAFVALVESKSAQDAAEKLGVAPSAISRRMKLLEERLGVSLAARTTRATKLTEEGRVFYERCVSLLSDLEEAEREVTQGASELTGRLSVTAPVSFGVGYLAGALADFIALHPTLEVNLDLSDRKVDLLAEGFDVAFRIGTLEDSSLIARRIGSIEHVVYCAPRFLDIYGPLETPEDLKTKPALCYSNSKSPERWLYCDLEGFEAEVKVKAKVSASSGEALREMAKGGVGVGCMPKFIIAEALESGELVTVLNQYRWFGMNLYALYPQTRHLNQKTRALIDYVVERFGGEPT